MNVSKQLSLLGEDITNGLKSYPTWSTFGWYDIKLRYRRSKLGPLWITLSLLISVTAMGGIYGNLFGLAISEYIPFLTISMTIWGLMSNLISESCMNITQSDALIKQVQSSYTLLTLRMVWRNLIIFLHNAVVIVLACLIFRLPISFQIWQSFVGIALILCTGVALGLSLGAICARFRDMQQIINSCLQIAFLATPVFWKADSLSAHRMWVVEYNPFYYFLEVVRAPMLGTALTPRHWLFAVGTTCIVWLLTIALYVGYRRRIAYWL